MHKYLFRFKDTRNYGVLTDHTAIIAAEDPFQAIEQAKTEFQHTGEIWRGFSIEIVIDDFTCDHDWKPDGRKTSDNKEAAHYCTKCNKEKWLPISETPKTRKNHK